MSKRRVLVPPKRGKPGQLTPPTKRGGGSGRSRPAVRRTPHDNVREAAAWVLERTLATSAPADTYLDSARTRCDDRDHALLNELVQGTLRWLRRLDHLVAAAADRRFEEIEEALHAPLRLAAYQLFFLDRLPSHAIVHEAVEQAHSRTHRGGSSFVNAVLRRLARDRHLESWPVAEKDPVRRLGIELSHPDLLVRRWLEQFGDETTRRLLQKNNEPKPMHLLAFRDRGGRELLAESLIEMEVDVEPSALAPLGLKVRAGNALYSMPFELGDFYVQDEASQLAALLPPPRPGETVLDLAAAPGGKTLALVSFEPRVRATAVDVSLPRLALMRRNLVRLDRRGDVSLVVADAAASPFRASFDRVILDLPCSGTGTLRKNPELKWRIRMEEIERLAAQGESLLEAAAERVRSGGLLSVITCSLEVEENEQLADRFLARHTSFERLPLGEMEVPPVGEPLVGDGFWRLLPAADHDGMTVTVLRRRGASALTAI